MDIMAPPISSRNKMQGAGAAAPPNVSIASRSGRPAQRGHSTPAKGIRGYPDSQTLNESEGDFTGLGSVGIHREFITAAARWIIEAKL
jgi:hypothetical protein